MSPQASETHAGFRLDLEALSVLQERPETFTPGEELFWDDPHISAQMLAAHLDPKSDAASRRPHTIDREVAWLVEQLRLDQTTSVLDLGCGPGLYASRLAQRKIPITGMDYSRRSIAYARTVAEQQGLGATYILGDYLELDADAAYNTVLLINGDFCVLSPEPRSSLLRNVFRALEPGGRLVLDVVTPQHRARYRIPNQWFVSDGGFWRPARHLVLEQSFVYPTDDVLLNQYVVIDDDGTMTTYRNWFQNYTPTSIAAVLEEARFSTAYVGGDLRGGGLTDTSEWIGIIAQKPPRLVRS